MIKTRTLIILFLSLLLISAAAGALVLWGHTAGTLANIYQDGVCVHSVDLALVREAYELEFSSEHGTNTVRVEPGRICVTDSDCPDRVCVNSGWLSDSAAPIVCLPHKLVIRIEGGAGAPDAVSR